MTEFALGDQAAAAPEHGKLRTELIKLFWTFLYLFILFGTLVMFRSIILAEHGIDEVKYGIAAIKALIFAKVILIGDWLKLGNRSDKQPLLYSVLAKSAAFAALFILFHFIETGIEGLFKGETVAALAQADAQRLDVAMGAAVIFMVTLIPFFFFREVTRVLGPARVRTLLLEHGGLSKLLRER
jgi:hypothetical protein